MAVKSKRLKEYTIQTLKKVYDKRQTHLKETFINLKGNLLKAQKKRVVMEKEFDKRIERLLNKHFPDTEQGWRLSSEDFQEKDGKYSKTRSKKFYDVQSRLMKLFYNDLVSFCYKYFSTIKYTVLENNANTIYESFYKKIKIHRDLIVLSRIADETDIIERSFYATKPHDSSFSYLLERLEQMIALRTNNSVLNVRRCLYSEWKFSFDVDDFGNIHEFFHTFICLVKYSHIPNTLKIRTLYNELRLDAEETFCSLAVIHENSLNVDIVAEYSACLKNNDQNMSKYKALREHYNTYTNCCYIKNRNLLKSRCKEHNEILYKIKENYNANNLKYFYEYNRLIYEEQLVFQLDIAYETLKL
ncbi:hypothetical protein CDIK_1154 [Cucumispora dikerogammari]|nr:hypothetical protein CDIK_1154 [Cucumispora dikerogammari]